MHYLMNNIFAKLLQAVIAMAMVMIMCDFVASPVEGQMDPTYASYNYRELFPQANGDLFGYGSTEAYYNTYDHLSRVVLTLTSPSGRVASYDTGYPSGYASADVTLSFDDTDHGTYNFCADHRNFCPVIEREFGLSTVCLQAVKVEKEFTYKRDFIYESGIDAKYLRCHPQNLCKEHYATASEFTPPHLPIYMTSKICVLITDYNVLCIPKTNGKTAADSCVPDPIP